MDRLGIEMLSVFGMPPIEYVNLTAELGCRYITTGLASFSPEDAGIPAVFAAGRRGVAP